MADLANVRVLIPWDVRNCAGVYCLRFPDGRFYIGSSRTLRVRLVEHTGRLWSGGHRNPKLQRAWNRFKTVSATPLLYCRPKDVLFYEQLCMDRMGPTLNLSFLAAVVSWTQESRDKVSRARKGFRHTEATKARISAIKKGCSNRVWTEEQKEARAVKMRGRKARPWTDQEKAAIAAGMRKAWAEGRVRHVDGR